MKCPSFHSPLQPTKTLTFRLVKSSIACFNAKGGWVLPQRHGTAASWPNQSIYKLLLAFGIAPLCIFVPTTAHAVTSAQVQITAVTPFALVDSNNACTQGPTAMYVQVNVKNTSLTTLTNLSANINTFTDSKFKLSTGELPDRFIGNLAPNATASLYWFVSYCHSGNTTGQFTNYSVTLSDSVSPFTKTGLSLTARKSISASAGGDVASLSIGSGVVAGQIVPLTVNYSFGNPANGADIQVQPAGNVSFNPGCYQLRNAVITTSNFTAGPVNGSSEKLYFTGVNGSSSNSLTVVYYFKALCTNQSTVAKPYAEQDSGGEKYTSNFSTQVGATLPQPTNAFTITKAVSSTSPSPLPTAGGTATYTITITNTSSFDSRIEKIVDVLPSGLSFLSTSSGTNTTSSTILTNSSKQPTLGATGTIEWVAQPSATAANDLYLVPANSSIKLVYSVTVPSGDNSYLNSATAQLGTLSIGPATATVIVGTPPFAIAGRVFEDINYGGGAGRTYSEANTSAQASGFAQAPALSGDYVGVLGARVELYNAANLCVASTTSDAEGKYSFTQNTTQAYTVRVVNSTVASNRAGYLSTLLPVQTFRTSGDADINAVADGDRNRVGGTNPALVDSVAAPLCLSTGGTSLSTLTVLGKTAQSIANVTVTGQGMTGIDFGYNFDTIVNTNDAGQGSLRQFVANANLLSNTSLNQDESANSVASAVTKNAGIEHSIFMIPNASDPLSRPADSNYTSALSLDGGSGSTFKITLTTGSLIVIDSGTAIDGRTQTALTGDTNAASSGSSTGPEVVITGNTLLSLDLLTVAGENMLIDSIGLVKAHNLLNGAGALGRGLVIGSVNLIGISNPIIVRNSTIALNDTNGVLVSGATANSSNGIQITNNVIRGNGMNSTLGNAVGLFGNGIALLTNGLSLTNGSIKNVLIQGNTLTGNTENGLKVQLSVASNVAVSNLNIQGNTVSGNGTGTSTAKDGISFEAVVNAANVSALSNSSIKDSQIIGNQIISNAGNGVSLTTHVDAVSLLTSLLVDPITAITISQNSTYSNSALGIELEKSVLLSPTSGVTPNDNGDTDIGPNEFLNFPAIETAAIVGQNLVIKGWARPGATIELFLADTGPNPSPLPGGYTKSFGEGQTYLLSLQEGSTSGIVDTDSTQSTYTNDGTGASTTKTENRFMFTIPLSGLSVALGSRLTTTATVNNSTSESSGVTSVSTSAKVLLVKRITEINGDRTQNPNNTSFKLNQVLDRPSFAADDAFPTNNWPSSFLVGAYDAGPIKPSDIVEYTVYFMNSSGSDANNVKICDRIVGAQQFFADAYGTGKDIEYKLGANAVQYLTKDSLTSVDRAELNASTGAIAGCPAPSITGTNNGTVVMDVTGSGSSGQQDLATLTGATTQGSPINSYGYFRFKTKINP
jgi:trimeric autotransporter adhesin